MSKRLANSVLGKIHCCGALSVLVGLGAGPGNAPGLARL